MGTDRTVIKSRGPGISSGYYECGPRLLSLEKRRKIEPKEILGVWITVVLTRQLKILVTTLGSATKKLLQHRIELKQQYTRDIAPLTA